MKSDGFLFSKNLFVIAFALLFAGSIYAGPLEITDIDVNRIGVNLPNADPDALSNLGEKFSLEAYSDIYYGEFGWEVHCRLDTGAVDIVFVIDSSGSMGGTISNVRAAVGGLITALNAAGYDYMLGAITYADGRNLWDFNTGLPGIQMTPNAATFQSRLAGVGAWGGDDSPEQSLDAIADAINRYEWRPEAMHIVIGFTDASYCQVGNTCSGFCNPGGGAFALPAAQTDAGVAALIASTGTVVFWACPTYIYSGYCETFTSPVPPHPPWSGTGFLGWYQYFCSVSGGKWYDLYSTSWSTIFADVAALISTFFTISIEVTNNTATTINPVTATLVPGACISVLSTNPISFGPLTGGAMHRYIWRIDYDPTCPPGPMLCFDVNVAGGGYADTAVGCLYMEDCECAGPVPTVIRPLPCGVWTACEYQDIVIEFLDDDVGTNPASIQLMVDGVLYSYPTYMTWTSLGTTTGRLTFYAAGSLAAW